MNLHTLFIHSNTSQIISLIQRLVGLEEFFSSLATLLVLCFTYRLIMGLKWYAVLLGVILLGHYTGAEETREDEDIEELSKARFRRQSVCQDSLKYCSQWPDKYCQDYKDYMKKNCAKKCGYCSGPTQPPVCNDQSQHCSGWKASGYCDPSSKWNSYMKSNCAKTCGFCGGGGGGGSGGDCSGSASSLVKACNFDSDTCDWTDVPFDDHIDFTRVSGSTSNGPSSGHGGSGSYLVAKGQSGNSGQLLLPLEIVLPHSQTNTKRMCLRFQYSIGSGGKLNVYEIQNRKGQPKKTLKSLSDSSSSWKCGKVSVNVSTKFQVLLEAVVSSGPVAIDEISFADGDC